MPKITVFEFMKERSQLTKELSCTSKIILKRNSKGVTELETGSTLNSKKPFRDITKKAVKLSSSQLDFCVICDEELTPNDSFLGFCGHSFCLTCLEILHKEKLIVNNLCPLERCKNSLLNTRKERNLLDNYTVKDYSHFNKFALFSNSHRFRQIVGNEQNNCVICGSSQLADIENIPFKKCLNCLAKNCRFCKKQFDTHHLNIKKQGKYCKVAFRPYLKKKRTSDLKSILISVFVLPLVSYLFLIMASIWLSSSYFGGISRIFCVIVVSPLIIVFFVLLIPFFPMIYSLR